MNIFLSVLFFTMTFAQSGYAVDVWKKGVSCGGVTEDLGSSAALRAKHTRLAKRKLERAILRMKRGCYPLGQTTRLINGYIQDCMEVTQTMFCE